MCSVPILLIIVPVSNVFLIGCLPDHGALAFLDIINPHSLVIVARRIDHLTEAILNAIFEIPLENRPISKLDPTLSVPMPLLPLATIGRILSHRGKLAIALLLASNHLPDILTSIRPGILALSLNNIIPELPLIDNA